jgi:hypothetical protein
MQIARKSPFSGRLHTMDLPVTEDQIRAYAAGAMVQDAFPQLSPAQREFFKTGITPEEWDEAFKEEDE